MVLVGLLPVAHALPECSPLNGGSRLVNELQRTLFHVRKPQREANLLPVRLIQSQQLLNISEIGYLHHVLHHREKIMPGQWHSSGARVLIPRKLRAVGTWESTHFRLSAHITLLLHTLD
eukprot:CAMPEP_0204263652 /NCGR_PEP_ID=MMETSP0468-20130131/8489_1 /ASSEMBLY_ACC=CAM_ASM_000383 /TAXON_ID=2969 /ORGANISM="Oxyrrhis marina" /LENGTH=118 /DNA_ID=CAMNT_0051238439 /DNA_START=268 /DNA_END=624 /DNA_ORIENTATION=-